MNFSPVPWQEVEMIENVRVSRVTPTDAELLAASLEHPESFRTLFERHAALLDEAAKKIKEATGG